jgi:hypothetical protein
MSHVWSTEARRQCPRLSDPHEVSEVYSCACIPRRGRRPEAKRLLSLRHDVAQMPWAYKSEAVEQRIGRQEIHDMSPLKEWGHHAWEAILLSEGPIQWYDVWMLKLMPDVNFTP